MDSTPKYYIVEASALPEVFLKVAEAKRLLDSGEASTVGEATKLTGISRSAFYKYKDAVQPFQDMKAGQILTFYALLKDNPVVTYQGGELVVNGSASTSYALDGVKNYHFTETDQTGVETSGADMLRQKQ